MVKLLTLTTLVVLPLLFSLATYAQLDSDSDGIDDRFDNCRLVANPNQLDTNQDGYGNQCDPDLDNNCLVDLEDLSIIQNAIFSSDESVNWNPDCDLNADGRVNFLDFGPFIDNLNQTPGPAGEFACGAPVLPLINFDYVAYAETNLPDHFINPSRPGNVTEVDNTPADNPITNAGATLGRVLFYDKRLSVNDTVACASCHQRSNGFDEPDPFSTGFQGGITGRHSMALANVRYYGRGGVFGGVRTHMFWDERANSLEEQALMPIQNPIEMGQDLIALVGKLGAVDFYPALFAAAFGTPAITAERIAQALAQFERSMVSYQSVYDLAFSMSPDVDPNLSVFTAQERVGAILFGMPGLHDSGPLKCDFCHANVALNSANTFNNGLDAITVDPGTAGVTPGPVEFKAPSLRNVALRGRFMHDGRFSTLQEVVEFYDSKIQPHEDLHFTLKNVDGTPIRMNLSQAEKDALVAFMQTMTDFEFLNSPLFADPFINNPAN